MKDGLLIDANLLLVMIIGGIDEGKYIKKSKRLKDFCVEDYYALWKLVEGYRTVWITPYIAAEVSNLIDLDGEAGVRAFLLAREIFSKFKQTESVISEDCEGDFFIKFGITDNSIINFSKNFDIITNDGRIAIPLYTIGGDRVIPFIPYKTLNS